MNVAYVLSQNKGGLPHYAAELANAVARHADVIVFKPAETSADGIFSDAVETVDVFGEMNISIPDMYNLDFNVRNNLRGLLSYRNLQRLDEFDPDVIHDPTDFFPQVKFFTKRYGLDERYPFVVTHHEVPPPVTALSSPLEAFEELLNVAIPDAEIDHIVVHSDQQRAAFEERLDHPTEIEVIPHGVYEFFTDYDYEQLPEEAHTLLFFGNIFPGKGLDVLAEAVQLASRELPDLKLVVAGDGPLSDSTEQLVDAANDERFEMHNYFVPNERVGELFSRAALIVLPYRRTHDEGTKGHSGVLSTAHSFGKPVVATRTGDFPAQVEEMGAGLVVPPADPAALAEAIVELLTDDERRSEMAANSRKQGEKLSWETIAERYLAVYKDAIGSFHARANETEDGRRLPIG
ncbi:glycosyltransferase family 4 protein [Halococcus thailandensis]|uniref:Lipopolysaccharide transferase family protein n=1 Tax=Halococcus thailandensis JCM 13552 TaxID=1227457 RepID=M0NEA8_9EURY|nr:glycosyltransferase family 4 protein [Halococcus thailandensis]EMA56186.1 lipopolysaccharide transferase family protein [Halococcus thailandensis JCM 13552]